MARKTRKSPFPRVVEETASYRITQCDLHDYDVVVETSTEIRYVGSRRSLEEARMLALDIIVGADSVDEYEIAYDRATGDYIVTCGAVFVDRTANYCEADMIIAAHIARQRQCI